MELSLRARTPQLYASAPVPGAQSFPQPLLGEPLSEKGEDREGGSRRGENRAWESERAAVIIGSLDQ